MSLFFFNDTATTEIYTLSLHDALPISLHLCRVLAGEGLRGRALLEAREWRLFLWRSEEHTSELQSHLNLVCRLLLEKKNPDNDYHALAADTHATSLIELVPYTFHRTLI